MDRHMLSSTLQLYKIPHFYLFSQRKYEESSHQGGKKKTTRETATSSTIRNLDLQGGVTAQGCADQIAPNTHSL